MMIEEKPTNAKRTMYVKADRLAMGALGAALAQKPQQAMYYIQRIDKECGGAGLTMAILTWCDAYASHATDGKLGSVMPSEINLIDASSGKMLDPRTDPVPAQVAWAIAAIEARCRMDFLRFDELIRAVPDNDAGRYLGQVLDCVAYTINGLPRGFARMGKNIQED